MEMRVKVPNDVRLAFNELTDSLQRQVQRKMLKAASTAIKKEYRKRTPIGRKTGTTALMSKKSKRYRGEHKNRLKSALVDKTSGKWRNKRSLAKRGILRIVVGYNYSVVTKGNVTMASYAHLVNDGHVAVYWGHRGGGRVKGTKHENEAIKAAKIPVKLAVIAKSKQAIQEAAKKARQKMLQVSK